MEGYCFGVYRLFTSEDTKEKIETAKAEMVEELCDEIRRLSKEYPEEFFITKNIRKSPIDEFDLSIGAKLIIPTITNYKYKGD